MVWLLSRLGAAFLTGVGLKLGAEAYELIKVRVQQRQQDLSDEAAVTGAEMAAVVVDDAPADA